MAKNLKLKVKNTQLAKALNLTKKVDSKKKDEPAPKKKEEEPLKAEVKNEAPKSEKPAPKKEPAPVAAQKPANTPSADLTNEKKSDPDNSEEIAKKMQKKATNAPTLLKPEPKALADKEAKAKREPIRLSPSKDQIGYIRPGTDKTARLKQRQADAIKAKELEEKRKKEETEKKANPPAVSEKTEDDKKQKAFRSPTKTTGEETSPTKRKSSKFKEFKESSTLKKFQQSSTFDSRDRQGLRSSDEGGWRRRKQVKRKKVINPEDIVRPTALHIKLPITLKDLAQEMKRKAAELVAKLFMQGLVLTLNDFLDDETTVQLLGDEFGCAITIDTSEEERLQITGKTIQEEISESPEAELKQRSPIITFMGHVDHGKTSLIDAFRESNLASGEAGAITQHIGAFRCKTPTGGSITLLDTPGHEAFTSMRERGATATDIIILVVAGDEGIKQQTIEAIELAKEAGSPMIVAINKSDKPGFNPEEIYRQMADHDLLPEAWGGSIVTANVSALTKEGLNELLELVLLQAEILELKANPSFRARGIVIESQMQKGLGDTATLLIQNGTLKTGDSLVIENVWGRIKTIHDEKGKIIKSAGPSVPVKVTGISGLPDAGSDFIVVANEKEARKLSKERSDVSVRMKLKRSSKGALESLLQSQVEKQQKKILNIILKTDVHGSIEAIETSLNNKINSEKAEINILKSDVGNISESDIQFAAASNAVLIGFHVSTEMHAEPLLKELQVEVELFDVIYHLIDNVRDRLTALLDKVREETKVGSARVQQTFKSSQLGVIAGCIVTDGVIKRSNYARLMRKGEQVFEGNFSSLKRVQDDVKEVTKGIECGILLKGFSDYQVDDEIDAYSVAYVNQEL
ncbi:MAG: translation initiation factor IF-2 [Rhabdochlamydiaceae bacterium]|nr:translation initiation factor IF-2 [Candidatus Amphrikana amoebophyrae]